jgi:hypothetical protein
VPTRKIADLPAPERWTRPACAHPDHSPPSMIVLPPGQYEHTCPACGSYVQFFVSRPMLTAPVDSHLERIWRAARTATPMLLLHALRRDSNGQNEHR